LTICPTMFVAYISDQCTLKRYFSPKEYLHIWNSFETIKMIWIKISSHTAYLNIHIHVQTARRCILNTFKNTNTFDHEYLFSYTCPSNFKTTLIRLNLNQSRNIISWKSIKYWIIILTVKPLWLTQYLSIIYERIYQQNAKPWHRRVQICQKFL